MSGPRVLVGPSSLGLGRRLEAEFGCLASYADVRTFPDGESRIEARIPPGLGPLFILHGTHPPQDRHLQQLYQLLDVAVAAGERDVICIAPYLAYARQDRRTASGEPLSVEIVLRTLAAMGASKLLVVDVHNPSSLAGRHLPAINLSSGASLAAWLLENAPADPVLISPDEGGDPRVRDLSARLGWPFLICPKTKDASGLTWYEAPLPDLSGRTAVVVDDLCSSGSTFIPLARRLAEAGAADCLYGVVHFFADPAALQAKVDLPIRIFTTDTVPSAHANVSITTLLHEAMQRELSPALELT